MKSLGIIFLLILGSTRTVTADTQKDEWCSSLISDREIYLKYPDQADYVPPTSNVQSPFDLGSSIDSLPTNEIVALLSGYYCDSPNNHPILYASSDGFTVIGVGFVKNYDRHEFRQAVIAYEELLVSAGYVTRK